jgi:hypothetical protein
MKRLKRASSSVTLILEPCAWNMFYCEFLRLAHTIFVYILRLFVCAARIYAYRFISIPMTFKGRNHVQVKSKYKILMLFLDQNFTISNGAIGFAVSSVKCNPETQVE